MYSEAAHVSISCFAEMRIPAVWETAKRRIAEGEDPMAIFAEIIQLDWKPGRIFSLRDWIRKDLNIPPNQHCSRWTVADQAQADFFYLFTLWKIIYQKKLCDHKIPSYFSKSRKVLFIMQKPATERDAYICNT